MHVDVAVADARLDGRHGGVAHHRVDQACAPARDDDVDQAAGLDQVGDGGAVVAGKQLHGIGGQALLAEGGAQRGHQRGVRARGRRAAAQQHGVAGLQRQAEGVDGDVGPALVDHADHAERHALLADLQTIGQRAAAQHLADRIGQPSDLAQSGGDAVDPLRVEGQPVEHGLGRAGGPGDVEVLGVRGQDLVHPGEHRVGRRVQCPVLGRGGQRAQGAGGDPRPTRGIVNLRAQVGTGPLSRVASLLPSEGASTLIRPAYRACARMAERTPATKSSGFSHAAKWPPESCSIHSRMSNSRSP